MLGLFSQVTSCEPTCRNERFLGIHDIIDTTVGVEGCLNLIKDDDGTVGTSAAIVETSVSGNVARSSERKEFTLW